MADDGDDPPRKSRSKHGGTARVGQPGGDDERRRRRRRDRKDRRESGGERRRERDRDRDDDRDRGQDRRRRRRSRDDRGDDDGASFSSSLSSSSSSESSASSSGEKRATKRRRRGDGRGDDDGDDDRKRKEHKVRSKKKKDGRGEDRKRDRKDRKKEKRKKKDKKRKKDKKKRMKRSRSRSRSRSPSSPASPDKQQQDEEDRLKRNVQFADALRTLLTAHPDLSTELPYLLIRMAGGTTFDLSSMPDASAASKLAGVFDALSPFGVVLDGTGSWSWTADGGHNRGAVNGGGPTRRRPGTELVLLKVVRSLLGGIGITADAADAYEVGMKEIEKEEALLAEETQRKAEAAQREFERAQAEKLATAALEPAAERRDDGDATEEARSAARSLLNQFEKRSGVEGGGKEGEEASSSAPSSSSLPAELGGICNLIMEGESVVLDGIPDDDLRRGLEGLFVRLGLVRTEVEEEEEDSEDGGGDGAEPEVVMGYALPDGGGEANDLATMNVRAVLEECQDRQLGGGGVGSDGGRSKAVAVPSKGPARRPVQGPAMGPPPGFSASAALRNYNYSDDDDDDEGPAPIGSELARRRQRIGPAIPADAVRAMAEKWQLELSDAAGGGSALAAAASAGTGGREEWMLVPGEHDFLKGIKSANPCKSRKFKNEKARGGGTSGEASAPLGPEMQAQMDAIRNAQAEARGPSLIEQHRLKKAEEKAAAEKSGEDRKFNWSRDKDLDAGRRVDKNALHMVLGGASDALKDKFHGSFSRGFM